MSAKQNPQAEIKDLFKKKAPREKTKVLRYWELAEQIALAIPEEELDKMPHDASVNYKHYLYGHTKAEA